MIEVQKGTTIAVGLTDGYRYVGITPPLSNEEISSLRDSEVLQEDFTITQIDEFEPQCTRITVSDHTDHMRSNDNKTKRAVLVAKSIAGALERSRDLLVDVIEEPEVLNGYNSSPFYPDTDFLRGI